MTTNEEFSCIFCKESFDAKEDLQIHFRKHGDPKFNHTLKKNLSDEMQSNEKQGDCGMVSCDVCPEVFPTISKAITHKHKVHPDHDAKYFCPWCGKLFTMKHLYNKHIESSHESKEGCEEKGFHCDYCEVDFFMASAMLYHNKFFHRQDTELAVIGQSRKLKVFNQEPLPIYYCPFCGEEYYNKVNLHKHMGDDHSDENQSPDDILRCPLCDAVFYHLDAYEIHLTFHCSEDIYSEENELIKEVTEFSLEAVPPLMEKVENDTQENAEATMNSIGIENFLQQAMNESIDNDNSNSDIPEKRKKHKKHKKSKKSVITLDEFLNMNKDVFGDGIDFQGIEEVPTQVVAKQLKKTSKIKPKVRNKPVQSIELEKLKKQGITIKSKAGTSVDSTRRIKSKAGTCVDSTRRTTTGLPINKAQITAGSKAAASSKPNILNPKDVISRLMNQTNSQLKIVKKSSQDETTSEKDASSIADNLNKLIQKTERDTGEGKSDTHNNTNDKVEFEKQSVQEIKSPGSIKNTTNDSSDVDRQIDSDNIENINKMKKDNTKDENEPPPDKAGPILNKLSNSKTVPQNVSSQLTIKTVTSSNNDTRSKNQIDDSVISETNNEQDSEKSTEEQDKISHKKTSLDVLKHLSHLVVKSVNNIVKGHEVQNLNDNEKEMTNAPRNSNREDANDVTDETTSDKLNDTVSELKQDIKPQPNTLDAIKSLGKHLTIKPVSQSTNDVKTISNKITDNELDEKQFNEDDLNTEVEKIKEPPKTLNAIKSLSKHLIIKPVSKSTNHANASTSNKITGNEDEEQFDKNYLNKELENSITNKKKPDEVKGPSKTFDAIKKLGKDFTIKPVSQSINPTKTTSNKVIDNKSDEENFGKDDLDEEMENSFTNKSLSGHKLSGNITVNRVIHSNNKNSPCNSPKAVVKNSPFENLQQEELAEKRESIKIESYPNILKQHRNITSKSISTQKHIPQTSSSTSKNFNQNVNVKKGSIQQQIMKTQSTTKEAIEVFNIDDSEDEEEPNSSNVTSPLKVGTPELTKNKSMECLKNLSKHIIVKSNNTKNPLINNESKNLSMTSNHEFVQNPIVDKKPDYIDDKNIKLQNTLKNLSKHISVKSNNSTIIQDYKSEPVTSEPPSEDEYHSDDSFPSKVQITELNDEYCSDSKLNDGCVDHVAKNVIVEAPNDSDDNEYNNVEQDIENVIKQNKVKEQTNSASATKNPINLNHLKNITIKSSKEESLKQDEEVEKKSHNISISPNVNNELALTPFKPPLMKRPGPASRTMNQFMKVNSETTNQTSINQRASTSSQINTVNKEVTVKTIQNNTVIEEITTTTVTKTIRTVNQSMQHISQSSNSASAIRPPRPPGIRQIRPAKNFQGVTVRQSAPNAGPRIRNPTLISPTVGTIIRPPNPTVTVKSGLNISGPRTPRMHRPTARPLQKPVVGKPLKIAPTAMSSMSPAMKRTADDSNRPFSCFKKPKESLIPVPDIPEFDDEEDADGTVQFASSSNLSRSNMVATKVIRGNSVVTSTQSNFEKSASSQQMSKCNNMTGVKIVKTSQSKQASHFEQKCEMSASKRSAMEAIEKLQKQGLLIKKPRQDEESFSDQEHSESDDY